MLKDSRELERESAEDRLSEKELFSNATSMILARKKVERGELEWTQRIIKKEITKEEIENLTEKYKWEEIKHLFVKQPGESEQSSLSAFLRRG